MTRSQPNASLAELDLEIERTLLRTQQARRRLDYTASTSALHEEHTESLDRFESDLESATSYSSVGTTDTSSHSTGQAKEWYYSQPDEVVTNWDSLRREFLDKFFPLEKTDYIRKEISGIMQRDQETLYEYWSQFKRPLETCPHHGLNTHLLISYFTGGLCAEDRRLLTASSGGSLSKNKTEAEEWILINDVANATQHVRVRSNPLKGVAEASPSEASLTKVLGDMTTIPTEMHKEQKAFYSIQAVQVSPQVPQTKGPPRICGLCFSTAHYTDQCHQIQEEYTLAVANVNYNNRPPYQNQGHNNYSHGNNSNQGWRDNAQGNHQYQRYQAPHQRQQPNQASSSSTNQVDELRAIVKKNKENSKAQFSAVNAQLANITKMISILALPSTNNTNQLSSSSNLPSQPLPNPKGALNAITLRSETTLKEILPRALKDIHEEEVVVEAPHEEDEMSTRQEEGEMSLKEPTRKATMDESIPIPFPSMIKKAKKAPEFDLNMLQVFKKVEVTIPNLDVIQ
ncbi:uncharacterized protein LOC107477554 [Arachis duranensis]|uniref:Uncharacterized protein LOC107477554 n=1 Tax=Arachis duranensis TaxID=130453 RepID=A0A6P4CKK0_ARADU|nr:uncharacterized protein LOC107477554 [Arachis duranensis]